MDLQNISFMRLLSSMNKRNPFCMNCTPNIQIKIFICVSRYNRQLGTNYTVTQNHYLKKAEQYASVLFDKLATVTV